jgi:hypothetical protein
MHTVIIVNGKARAGKNSAVTYMRSALADKKISSCEYSSIDPVIDLLFTNGINVSKKTDADRKLLAILGDALEEHSGFRSSSCMIRNETASIGKLNFVFFVFTREIYMIEKLKRKLDYDRFLTLFVESSRVKTNKTNHVDAAVYDPYDYDDIIENDGTKGQLLDKCEDYINKYFS